MKMATVSFVNPRFRVLAVALCVIAAFVMPLDYAHALTVSGRLYSDEAVTAITVGKTIKMAIATGSPATIWTTTTNGSGDYSFSNVEGAGSGLSVGTRILVWVVDGTATQGSAVTTASSTASGSNITGLDIYKDRVIIGQEGTATTTTNTDIAYYHGTNDATIPYTVSGTGLTVNAGKKLYIRPGKSYRPGGTVTLHGKASSSPDGDLFIGAGSTFVPGGAVSVAGDLTLGAGATFVAGPYTVTFTATTTGKIISGAFTGSNTLGSIAFGGSGSWTFANNASTTNFTITSGAVTAPPLLTIAGNYSNAGTFTHASGTVYMVEGSPSTPTITAGVDAVVNPSLAGNSNFTSVYVSGNYLYATKAGDATDCSLVNKAGCELQIYDISTPASPTFVGGADAGGTTNTGTQSSNFTSVYVSGSYAYVANGGNSTNCNTAGNKVGCELQIYDISTPATPTFVGGADAGGTTNTGTQSSTFNSVYVSGSYAYVAKNSSATDCNTAGNKVGCELQIYDISTPASPTFVGGADASGTTNTGIGNSNFTSVYVSGSYAYVAKVGIGTNCNTAGNKAGCELQIYDISTPASPTFVGGADVSGTTNTGTGSNNFNSVYVSGSYAYVANNANTTDCNIVGNKIGCELQIYDISTPATPTFVGGADAAGTTNIGTGNSNFNSVYVSGSYAYVAKAGDSTECSTVGNKVGCEIQIYDLTASTSLAGTMSDTSSFYSLVLASDLSFTGNASTTHMTILAGTTTAPALLSIAGNYTNSGKFANNGGTVTLNGAAAQTLSGAMTGSNAFANLTISNTWGTPPGTVSVTFSSAVSATGTFTMLPATSAKFAAGVTSTFQNINWSGGANTQRIWVRSTTDGSPWGLAVAGTRTVTYVHVKDSNACLGATITPVSQTSVDGGGNSCWTIVELARGGGGEAGGSASPGNGTVGGGSQQSGVEIGVTPGFNAPGSFAAVSGWALAWTSPGNALSSDNSSASATGVAASDFFDFNFSVPAGNTVTGVTVRLEASASTAAGTIQAELSWNAGSATTTSALATGTLTTSDAIYDLGGPSATWGHSWVPAEFSNGNFRLRLVARPSSNTVRIDAIQVKVYHQVSGGSGGGGGEI